MTAILVPASSLVPRPWPNGRGVTRPIHEVLDGEGRLVWSLSLADLTQDAPFSHLPGLTRIFTVVAGAGVTLAFGQGDMLCPPCLPVIFPGEAAPASSLLDGPARAFNWMGAAGRPPARIGLIGLPPGGAHHPGPLADAVFVVSGSAQTDAGPLGRQDTVIVPTGEIRAGPQGAVLLIVTGAGTGT